MSLEKFNLICIIWSLIGVSSFILLQFVRAPYGRHVRKGWGKEIPNNLGWVLMELPSFLIILYFYLSFNQSNYAAMLSILWLVHYFNRSFIYPFRIRTKSKKMPITIVFSAIGFNFINAGLNGYFLSSLEQYDVSSFQDLNFYVGITLFISGFLINQISDTILIKLRKPDEVGYKIPRGFLFKYISCPNYFGEIIQWIGFAVMAWNFPATTFLIWTAANLLPRVAGHHKWYKSHFKNYPINRKALIPKLW
jgi:3-oxo-5-alpha-steroid 4-dehydrogenase 1